MIRSCTWLNSYSGNSTPTVKSASRHPGPISHQPYAPNSKSANAPYCHPPSSTSSRLPPVQTLAISHLTRLPPPSSSKPSRKLYLSTTSSPILASSLTFHRSLLATARHIARTTPLGSPPISPFQIRLFQSSPARMGVHNLKRYVWTL